MKSYDWAMVIISYFLSFSYNRIMQIWKQKKKERMSLGLGLDLWWPNWLRRSLIIKRKGGACKGRLVTIFPILKTKREIHVEKEKKGSHQGRRQVAASKGRKELLVYSSYAHTRGVKERKRWQFSSFVGGIYSQSFIIHYTHLDQRTKEKKILI